VLEVYFGVEPGGCRSRETKATGRLSWSQVLLPVPRGPKLELLDMCVPKPEFGNKEEAGAWEQGGSWSLGTRRKLEFGNKEEAGD